MSARGGDISKGISASKVGGACTSGECDGLHQVCDRETDKCKLFDGIGCSHHSHCVSRSHCLCVAAGHPNCIFKISFDELLNLTNGVIKDIVE